jgi:hypothetical protein
MGGGGGGPASRGGAAGRRLSSGWSAVAKTSDGEPHGGARDLTWPRASALGRPMFEPKEMTNKPGKTQSLVKNQNSSQNVQLRILSKVWNQVSSITRVRVKEWLHRLNGIKHESCITGTLSPSLRKETASYHAYKSQLQRSQTYFFS